MFQIVFLVMFVITKCIFDVDAGAATKKPFVIFQPGEYFDPFTEKSLSDTKSSASASVASPPNVVFGEPSTIFNQNFWQLSMPTTSSSYPRPIGKASGNAIQFEAQIRQPIAQPFLSYTQPLVRDSKNKTEQSADKVSIYQKESEVAEKGIQTKGTSYLKGRVPKSSSLAAEASQNANSVVASELVAHPSHHAVSNSKGGGRSHKSGYHDSHGDKDIKDYKSNHHHNIKDFKEHDDHNKKSHHSEKGGHLDKHHDEAGHYKKHHEGKKSHKSAKFGEKKGHKRGHKTKGYHNKFHRDEYHREHRFYDDYNKEGYHEKHGKSHAHHKNNEGGHKNGGGHKSGHSSKKHGKKGFSDKGKLIDEDKGFDREGGRKKYHKHHKDYHKKKAIAKGKHYGYNKKH